MLLQGPVTRASTIRVEMILFLRDVPATVDVFFLVAIHIGRVDLAQATVRLGGPPSLRYQTARSYVYSLQETELALTCSE